MLSFLVKIRILPLTIFAAVLMLTLRLGDVVWPLKPTLAVNKVQAQANQPTPLIPDDQAPAAPKGAPAANAPATKGAPPPATKGGQGTGPAAAQAQQNAPSPPEQQTALADPSNDPTLFTQNEIDLLQQLAERREAIDKQNQEMNVRQAMLQAAEKRIDSKVGELRELQKAIDGLIKKHNEQEEEKIQSLVKIYENMKPKDAARIFDELDMETLLPVVEKMKERKLAPVMSNMDPTKAKEMTVRIANERKLPAPGTPVGG
jgi:flagellar motility protein MotE (MotC chaperone)